MLVVEMSMLKFMIKISQSDRIRSGYIRDIFIVKDAKNKLREQWLWWFAHMINQGEEELVWAILMMRFHCGWDRVRFKTTWE